MNYIILLLFFMLPTSAFSTVLFSDNFDSCSGGSECDSCGDFFEVPTPQVGGYSQWGHDDTQPQGGHCGGEISSGGRVGNSLKIWRANGYYGNYTGTLYWDLPAGHSSLYMSYYQKVPTGWDYTGAAGHKFWRFNTTAGGGEIYINYYSAYYAENGLAMYDNTTDWYDILTPTAYDNLVGDGQWHHFQWYINLATHTCTVWVDGNSTPVFTSTAPTGFGGLFTAIQHFPIGNSNDAGHTWTSQATWQAFEIDDLIIATTKAETDPDAGGTDTTPPVRSAGSPSGALAAGTTSTTMSLTTDEASTCKFSTSAGTSYADMTNTFTTTGGTSHSVTVSGLSNGGSYSRYIRCADDESTPNANTDDYTISWTVSTPSAGITPGNLLFSESFENNTWTARSWYDGTDSTGSTAGGYSGNGLRWAWAESATNPTGFSTIRNTFTSHSELFVEYYVKFETGWEGTHVGYHPHMIHLLSTADDAYQSLSATYNSLYIEAVSDASSPYTIRPTVAGQDVYRVNTSSGTPPNNLVATTETRSAYHCNTPYTLTDATNGACYSLGGGYYYSANIWTAQSVTIPANEWVRVRTYFKRNTFTDNVANFDGIVRVWVGDTLAIEDTGMIFAANAYATTSWDKIVLAPWIGDGSPKAQAMWIDELKVYDGYTDAGGSITAHGTAGGAQYRKADGTLWVY